MGACQTFGKDSAYIHMYIYIYIYIYMEMDACESSERRPSLHREDFVFNGCLSSLV